MLSLYKRSSILVFGRISGIQAFMRMKPVLQAAGISMLPRTYASVAMFTSGLVFIASIFLASFLLGLSGLDPFSLILFTFAIPIVLGAGTFAGFYFYPSQKASSVRKSIDNNMPFAVAHMSAISSAGIPPEYMFELLSGFKEYKEISRQASLVVRNMKSFGMSSVTALKSVSKYTPSPGFRQLLNGIAFNIENGGNLPKYLKDISEKNLFEYRLKREKYLKTLSTYADIYTALVVAAPLMMLSVLAILSTIGGEIIGLSIGEMITYLTFIVLPGMNIAFLAFIQFTYPGV